MRGPRPDRRGAWFAASLAGLVPAAALAGAGAGVLASGGVALGGGLCVIAAGAAFLEARRGQPRIDRRFEDERPEGIARRFLLRTLVSRSRGDLVFELGDAAQRLLGAERVLLLCVGDEGGLVILGGDGDETRRAGELGPVLAALAAQGAVVERDALLGASGAGATALLELFDALDVGWAAPLVHRGTPTGAILVGRLDDAVAAPAVRTERLALLASHAGTALARALLEEARHAPRARATGLGQVVLGALGPRGDELAVGDLRIAWARAPIAEGGGDLVLVVRASEDRVVVVLADGVGRGVPAVLGAARVHGAVLARVDGTHDPQELLRAADEALRAEGATPVAALAVVIDPRTRAIAFASAGLPPPLVVELRGGTPRARVLTPPASARRPLVPPPPRRGPVSTSPRAPSEAAIVGLGTPLGVAGEPLELVSQELVLAPDERLVLVTDGVTNAGAPYAHPLGLTRLGGLVAALGELALEAVPRAVLGELARLDAGRPGADDRSVVALVFDEPGADAPTTERAP